MRTTGEVRIEMGDMGRSYTLTPIGQRKASYHGRENSLSLMATEPKGNDADPAQPKSRTPNHNERTHRGPTPATHEKDSESSTFRIDRLSLTTTNAVVLACGVDSASARACPQAQERTTQQHRKERAIDPGKRDFTWRTRLHGDASRYYALPSRPLPNGDLELTSQQQQQDLWV
jgi:hypothetical protein